MSAGPPVRADEASDPRIFFAAERTLLAWIRTGLTVIGLGFVVARFGLFLRLTARQGQAVSSTSSTLLGVSFVVLGSAAIAMGVAQFVRFSRALPPSGRPQNYRLGWAVGFGALLAATGVILAVHLLLRSTA
jgi:putative membrane protein